METILLVDDEISVLKYLEKMLAAEGYSVHAVPCGELALVSAATHRPDLILAGCEDAFDGRIQRTTSMVWQPALWISSPNRSSGSNLSPASELISNSAGSGQISKRSWRSGRPNCATHSRAWSTKSQTAGNYNMR